VKIELDRFDDLAWDFGDGYYLGNVPKLSSTARFYQLDAIAAYELARENGKHRGIISFPTGAGKTFVFCNNYIVITISKLPALKI